MKLYAPWTVVSPKRKRLDARFCALTSLLFENYGKVRVRFFVPLSLRASLWNPCDFFALCSLCSPFSSIAWLERFRFNLEFFGEFFLSYWWSKQRCMLSFFVVCFCGAFFEADCCKKKIFSNLFEITTCVSSNFSVQFFSPSCPSFTIWNGETQILGYRFLVLYYISNFFWCVCVALAAPPFGR